MTATGTAPAAVAVVNDDLRYAFESLGITGGELVDLGTRPPGGTFRRGTVEAGKLVDGLPPAKVNLWLCFNTFRPLDGGGRPPSNAEHVDRVTCLFLDIDYVDKPVGGDGAGDEPADQGAPGKAKGVPGEAEARGLVAILSDMIGQRPVFLIHSGHGLQPVWALEGCRAADGGPLLKRWGRLAQHVASVHGWHLDSVFDVVRLVRFPGSTNWKDPDRPVPARFERAPGAPVSPARLFEACDEYGPGEGPAGGGEPLPEWVAAAGECRYVAKIVDGLPNEAPPERHPWLLRQCLRFAAADRLGCLPEGAWDKLRARFDQLTAGEDRRGEFDRARGYAVAEVAKETVDKSRARLGGHPHAAAGEQPAAPADVGGRAPAGGRVGRATRASDISPKKVEWAWKDTHGGRLPAGSLSIAAGREGTGKSSFGLWLAARITHGTLPGSFHGEPRDVFICAFEDSWEHTLVPRLMAAGADLGRVHRFDIVETASDTELTLSLPGDLGELKRLTAELGVALVIVDPLMSALSSAIDTHRERETRSALDPLVKFAQDTGAVVLGIAHFNKGTQSDAASLITGSGAFKNVPRSVFGFARSEDGVRVMSQVKNSLGRPGLPSLEYNIESVEVLTSDGPDHFGLFVPVGDTEKHVEDIIREQSDRSGEGRAERDAAAEQLREYLFSQGGTAPANKCVQHLKGAGFSMSNATLARLRDKAGIGTKKDGYGTGTKWVWYLKDAFPPEA